jgi:hypothetical protein
MASENRHQGTTPHTQTHRRITPKFSYLTHIIITIRGRDPLMELVLPVAEGIDRAQNHHFLYATLLTSQQSIRKCDYLEKKVD